MLLHKTRTKIYKDRGIPIFEYTLDGQLVGHYTSIFEASRAISLAHEGIEQSVREFYTVRRFLGEKEKQKTRKIPRKSTPC